MQLGGWTITDTHANGTISVAQVIQKSSNIGSAKITLQMSPERMGTFYRELGFGTAPQTGFPGEAKGVLRPWTQWGPSSRRRCRTATASRCRCCSSRALTRSSPTGASCCRSRSMKRDAQPIGKRVITKQTARRGHPHAGDGGEAGRHGAARAAFPATASPARPALRTRPEHGGYAENKYRASFVGFAPASDPRFIVAVMIDEPQGASYYGGDVAAPVFSTVMGAALRMMSVPPDAPGTLNVQARRADARSEG